jgi:hypothetical protein
MSTAKAFAVVFALALAVQTLRCFPGGEDTTLVSGAYRLSSIDIAEETILVYRSGDEAIGRIGATVFAASG